MQTNPGETGVSERIDPVPALQRQLQGDIFHDFVVPRYSALANSPRRPIVVIGTWLLMVPSILMSIMALWFNRVDGPMFVWLGAIPLVVVVVLSVAVVWKITGRRRRA